MRRLRSVVLVGMAALLFTSLAALLPAPAAATEAEDTLYVKQLYNDVLGIPDPAPAAVADWVEVLQDEGRFSVAGQFVGTNLYRALTVDRIYMDLLGRLSDGAGRSFWVERLKAGLTQQFLKVSIIASQEYFDAAGGNNVEFIKQNYRDVLHREAEPAGLAYWFQRLSAGEDRFRVSFELILTPEGAASQVEEQYQLYLRRAAEQAARNFWGGFIQRGGRIEELVVLLLVSDEYFGFAQGEDLPPNAVDDTASAPADTLLDAQTNIDVLANDTDPNGNLDPNSLTRTTPNPAHGSATVDPATDTIDYDPNAGFTGTDTFGYQVCDTTDPEPLCDTALVTVKVSGAPVATDDAATTDEDTPVDIDVLENDDDPDNDIDPASVSVTTAPADGTTSIDPATGEITYTPASNFNGADTFEYQVCDETSPDPLCDKADVDVTVDPVSDGPPTAVPDTSGAPKNGEVLIDVLANDTDPDDDIDPATLVRDNPPNKGTAVVQAGKIKYTPNVDAEGTDTFTYHVCDTTGGCSASAVVTVNIQPGPVAGDDEATTDEDTAANIDVLDNDTDPSGNLDPNSLAITQEPANGTATINGLADEIVYTPDANFNGADTFTYRVCDLTHVCDEAVVDVTVEPVADPPNAVNDEAETDANTGIVIDVLANDTDGDDDIDPASVTVTNSPDNGSILLINPVNGRITYQPDPGFTGTDTFTYKVCDGTAPDELCDTATVTVTVG